MTLINVKTEIALALPVLMRLVLKFIYEPRSVSRDERRVMEDSVIKWAAKAEKTEDEQVVIERIGWYLKKNEEGRFDKRIADFKQHGIDWRKYHRLPEVTPVGGYKW